MPPPPPPPWAPKRLAPLSRRQRSSSFPRPTRSHAHPCSRLTRQHGGEQSGLVTLTSDLLTLKVVFESYVTWATSVSIFVFLGLSVVDIGPMYATDRQTSDSIIALIPRLLGAGHNNCYSATDYNNLPNVPANRLRPTVRQGSQQAGDILKVYA